MTHQSVGPAASARPGGASFKSGSPRPPAGARRLYSIEHEAFRKSVRRFVEREVAPRYDSFCQERMISRDIWKSAGDLGILGLEVPKEYGGSGTTDWLFTAVVLEEFARFSAGFSSSLGIHFDIVAPYLVELTTPGQKARWLPGFSAGTLVAAIAMTEPSGGSDLANLRTTAHRVDGGWSLNGSKTFITNGSSADLVVVAARTDDGSASRRLSLFVVERGMKGFTSGPPLDKVGQPESDTSELFFDHVFVSDENLIGDRGRGFIHMMERLPQERLNASVSNIAHARGVFDETLEYARERVAFGQPIGTFQATRFRLAELSTKLDVSEAFVDDCVRDHLDHRLSAVRAAKAKWWTAEVQWEVLDTAVQVFGGHGYMREQRVARAWLDGRVTRIWAGTNEVMKELVGRDLGLG